jgi:hypothetical protein
MKRFVIVGACAVMTVLAFSGCNKKAAGGTVDPKAAGGKDQALVLRANAGRWAVAGGLMEWSEGLPLGDVVKVTGEAIKDAEYINKSKQSERYTVLPIKTSAGKEGYAIDFQLAVGATPAVVASGQAFLYKQPRDAALTEIMLPISNFIGIYPIDGDSNFYKVRVVDYINGSSYQSATQDYYIAAGDISTSASDINSAILLQSIRSLTNVKQRQKILETINSKYSDSIFARYATELVSVLDEKTLSLESVSATYTAKETATVYDIPSLFGTPVAWLKKGDTAQAESITTNEFTGKENIGHWVKIAGDKAGWVFSTSFEEDPSPAAMGGSESSDENGSSDDSSSEGGE